MKKKDKFIEKKHQLNRKTRNPNQAIGALLIKAPNVRYTFKVWKKVNILVIFGQT
jgi:hypothetical protein